MSLDQIIGPPPATEALPLDQLVNEYLDLGEQIAKDSERRSQVAELISRILPVGEKYEVAPGVGVRISSPKRTFDSNKAGHLLTKDQLRAISIQRLSVTEARKVLPGALVDLCMTAVGGPTVQGIR